MLAIFRFYFQSYMYAPRLDQLDMPCYAHIALKTPKRELCQPLVSARAEDAGPCSRVLDGYKFRPGYYRKVRIAIKDMTQIAANCCKLLRPSQAMMLRCETRTLLTGGVTGAPKKSVIAAIPTHQVQ